MKLQLLENKKIKTMEKIRFWEIIILIVAIVGSIFAYNQFKKPLSEKDFRTYEKEFRAEIDTIKIKLDRVNFQLDTIRLDVDTIKNNTDSLLIDNDLIYYDLDSIKKGQIIIYREIRHKRNSNNNNLFEKIKLLLK